MNKKTLIILACVALVLILAIAGGVYALYSGVGSGSSDKRTKADTALLAAIPSDAAAVMTLDPISSKVSSILLVTPLPSPTIRITAATPIIIPKHG